MIGITYRPELDAWLEQRPAAVGCVEIHAERFYSLSPYRLRWLSALYPILARDTTLSIGGPDPLAEVLLLRCASLTRDFHPRWISIPLGFSRAGAVDLGITTPTPLTQRTLEHVSERLAGITMRCGPRVLIENVASPLRVKGDIQEAEFLNRLCDGTGCGLLIDLPAAASNSLRDRIDPAAWLSGLNRSHVKAIRTTAREISWLRPLMNVDPAPTVVVALPLPGSVRDAERAVADFSTALHD